MGPRMRFCVAEQRCQTGEVVDYERMSSCAVVNFESGSGRQNNTAVISHDGRGEYRVQYFDQNECRDVLQAAVDGQLRSHIERHSNNQNNNNNNMRSNNHQDQNNNQNNDNQLRELTELRQVNTDSPRQRAHILTHTPTATPSSGSSPA